MERKTRLLPVQLAEEELKVKGEELAKLKLRRTSNRQFENSGGGAKKLFVQRNMPFFAGR